jgi:hypothetical protein
MQLPRIRISVRASVVAIALVAVLFGLLARRAMALALADFHESRTVVTGWACSKTSCQRICETREGKPATAKDIRNSNWHSKLADKYRLAAGRPWLPIEADPPEPE